jgi:hypothetical protein
MEQAQILQMALLLVRRFPNHRGFAVENNQAQDFIRQGMDDDRIMQALGGQGVDLQRLAGTVKGVTTTAATWGTLHAVGLNNGLAKDPFWTVLKQRNDPDAVVTDADLREQAARTEASLARFTRAALAVSDEIASLQGFLHGAMPQLVMLRAETQTIATDLERVIEVARTHHSIEADADLT